MLHYFKDQLSWIDLIFMTETNYFTFIVESINAINRRAFVVASQKEEILWEFDFVSKQEADRF